MAQIRKPKSEFRKKAEARNPNDRLACARFLRSGFRTSDFFRASALGFRISDRGTCAVPCPALNTPTLHYSILREREAGGEKGIRTPRNPSKTLGILAETPKLTPEYKSLHVLTWPAWSLPGPNFLRRSRLPFPPLSARRLHPKKPPHDSSFACGGLMCRNRGVSDAITECACGNIMIVGSMCVSHTCIFVAGFKLLPHAAMAVSRFARAFRLQDTKSATPSASATWRRPGRR